MKIFILPDELSLLVELIGRDVVFVLCSGTEVSGLLKSVSKDFALLVADKDESQIRYYVRLSNVAVFSVKDRKAEGG